MDRNVLRYLADLALVRQQSNNVLSVGRGMIDQKTLHKVSARAGQLDLLFVNVLLNGQIPGESHSQVNVNNDDLDYVDINQRIKEAKAQLNQKNPTVHNEEEEEEEVAPPPTKTASMGKSRKTLVERPDEEVEAFQRLLAEAEAEVEKVPAKTTKKKTSRRGKKAVSK